MPCEVEALEATKATVFEAVVQKCSLLTGRLRRICNFPSALVSFSELFFHSCHVFFFWQCSLSQTVCKSVTSTISFLHDTPRRSRRCPVATREYRTHNSGTYFRLDLFSCIIIIIYKLNNLFLLKASFSYINQLFLTKRNVTETTFFLTPPHPPCTHTYIQYMYRYGGYFCRHHSRFLEIFLKACGHSREGHCM